MTITLPVPSLKLSQNGRCHWRPKAKLTRAAKHIAWVEAQRVIGETFHKKRQPVPRFAGYSLAHFFKSTFRDDDNADGACKAYRDGIALALGIDDRDFRKVALSTFHKDPKNPRVEITLHLSES